MSSAHRLAPGDHCSLISSEVLRDMRVTVSGGIIRPRNTSDDADALGHPEILRHINEKVPYGTLS